MGDEVKFIFVNILQGLVRPQACQRTPRCESSSPVVQVTSAAIPRRRWREPVSSQLSSTIARRATVGPLSGVLLSKQTSLITVQSAMPSGNTASSLLSILPRMLTLESPYVSLATTFRTTSQILSISLMHSSIPASSTSFSPPAVPCTACRNLSQFPKTIRNYLLIRTANPSSLLNGLLIGTVGHMICGGLFCATSTRLGPILKESSAKLTIRKHISCPL